MLVEENIRAGMSPKEAQRAARIELGGIEQVKEQVREVRVGTWLQSALSDCRYGLTAVAIAALAIGIGANTGVFSVVDALLLHSLPFHEPDRLTQLHQFIPPHHSAKQFHDWRQQSTYLTDAALFEENDVNIGGVRAVSRAHVAQTSWNFFSVLGTQPILGRGFAPEDDVDGTGWGLPGRNAVAVIGYRLWQQLFGGDPKVLGVTIRIDGKPLARV
jgi:putative ABC transport system permease protein